MGKCESVCGSANNKPINDKICEIQSNTGKYIGIGFFCKYNIPTTNNALTIMITSYILDIDDFFTHNQIILNLIMSKRNITLNIDNNRKYYFYREYNISIIEIKETELQFTSLLELNDGLYNNLNQIYLIYYGINRKHEEFYPGNITSYNEDTFLFTNSYNKKDIKEIVGCPILDNEYRIIGITTTSQYNYNQGKFLTKPLEDFYLDNYGQNIKVIFHVSFLNEDYIVEAKEKYMFGELIIFFYFKSGLDFEENFEFKYHNNEIPNFSTHTLFQLDIHNNSEIYVSIRQFSIDKVINLIICLNETSEKWIVLVNPEMKIKEFLLKVCQIIRYPYNEFNSDYRLYFNSNRIIPIEESVRTLGVMDCSKFELNRLYKNVSSLI